MLPSRPSAPSGASASVNLSYPCDTCGHRDRPPGIVARPDGRIELLEDGRSFPLAAGPGIERREAIGQLPPRSTLLLYTDGLVERRRRSLDDGITQAGRAVQDGHAATVEDLATQIMTGMAPAGGYEDDVALVLYRHPAPLDLTFPAESGALAPMRATLRTGLSRCDVSHRTTQDVLVAVGEACANAVEHGHRNAPGRQIRLRAAATASP